MCTAATYKTRDFYFGRTLDYGFSYGEEVVVTPEGYPFRFRGGPDMGKHHGMIGMAHVAGDYPLYYDAVNEKGLGIAGLNFVGNAVYGKEVGGKDNIAQFELIPWILGQCATVEEVRILLGRINLTDTPFSEGLPAAQLHWLIADREEAITVESVEGGLRVYENPVGILTNNPPFDQQMFRLNDHMHLSPRQPENRFSRKLDLTAYSRGMGALGLPGDLSSQSRFIRAAFVKMNAVSGDSENESVSQFFHILGSVEQQRGCCELETEKPEIVHGCSLAGMACGGQEGTYEITLYTSCCNADRGIYYYTTYGNHQITAVDMHREDLTGDRLARYPLITGEQIRWQNR